MLQILTGVLMIGGTAAFIIRDKRKLSKEKRKPSANSGTKQNSELLQAEKLNEYQKGQGRAGGGPF
ncbi:MAG: hypothetical protein EA344_11385 [Alkalicoccus sp.]|nr:MAG: hypothetical protein EA344_11385 [Alkalicoccus sp.]